VLLHDGSGAHLPKKSTKSRFAVKNAPKKCQEDIFWQTFLVPRVRLSRGFHSSQTARVTPRNEVRRSKVVGYSPKKSPKKAVSPQKSAPKKCQDDISWKTFLVPRVRLSRGFHSSQTARVTPKNEVKLSKLLLYSFFKKSPKKPSRRKKRAKKVPRRYFLPNLFGSPGAPVSGLSFEPKSSRNSQK